MPTKWSLEDLIDILDRYHQRATYGAVADLVGSKPAFVMNHIQRAPRYSWVVNQKTLLPTEYAEHEMHASLTERPFVLMNGKELRAREEFGEGIRRHRCFGQAVSDQEPTYHADQRQH
jgi:hypothetical protein